MKTAIGIILGVISGLIIIAIVVVWLMYSVLPSQNQPPKSDTATIFSPTATQHSSPTSQSVPNSPSVGNKLPVDSHVDFGVNITGFQVSGLSSGTVSAQISNTGNADAHNVWAKIEIVSQGSIIKIEGKDYLRKDIGIIKAGQTVPADAAILVSITDGAKISQIGATIRLTIYSDEKTQILSYDFRP